MAVGLKFVKQVDENWRDHITFIDGSPYTEKNIVEEEIEEEKSILNKIEKFIDDKLEY